MKMKYIEHVDYSFTQEEKKFLNADHQLTGTCVIDDFIGMYGKKSKLTRDDFIKLHQDYYDDIFENSDDIWTVDDGITPLFLEYVCKNNDFSHYAYDINNECFMKYISKNQNHKASIY